MIYIVLHEIPYSLREILGVFDEYSMAVDLAESFELTKGLGDFVEIEGHTVNLPEHPITQEYKRQLFEL